MHDSVQKTINELLDLEIERLETSSDKNAQSFTDHIERCKSELETAVEKEWKYNNLNK